MAGGVFCIESWSGQITSKSSVLPLLQFLSQDPDGIRFVHQRVESTRELHHYMCRFAGLGSYGVAYIAMHGSPGKVYAGNAALTLDRLGDWARLDDPQPPSEHGQVEWSADLKGKVLYLGSCASLSKQERRVEALRKETGAIAICGYTRSVRWDESAAFELMLLPELAKATDARPRTVTKTLRRLRTRTKTLMETLGFVSYPRVL